LVEILEKATRQPVTGGGRDRAGTLGRLTHAYTAGRPAEISLAIGERLEVITKPKGGTAEEEIAEKALQQRHSEAHLSIRRRLGLGRR
jgi:hypothetical protein